MNSSEVNKGYSTTEGRFLAHYLASDFPLVTMNSEYYPGECIPSDGPSRNEALVRKELDDLAEKHSIRVRGIREFSV